MKIVPCYGTRVELIDDGPVVTMPYETNVHAIEVGHYLMIKDGKWVKDFEEIRSTEKACFISLGAFPTSVKGVYYHNDTEFVRLDKAGIPNRTLNMKCYQIFRTKGGYLDEVSQLSLVQDIKAVVGNLVTIREPEELISSGKNKVALGGFTFDIGQKVGLSNYNNRCSWALIRTDESSMIHMSAITSYDQDCTFTIRNTEYIKEDSNTFLRISGPSKTKSEHEVTCAAEIALVPGNDRALGSSVQLKTDGACN